LYFKYKLYKKLIKTNYYYCLFFMKTLCLLHSSRNDNKIGYLVILFELNDKIKNPKLELIDLPTFELIQIY